MIAATTPLNPSPISSSAVFVGGVADGLSVQFAKDKPPHFYRVPHAVKHLSVYYGEKDEQIADEPEEYLLETVTVDGRVLYFYRLADLDSADCLNTIFRNYERKGL